MRDNLDKLYDLFVDYELVSKEALDLVIGINGYSYDTFMDILYYISALRNLEQLANDLQIEYEDWMQELDDEN